MSKALSMERPPIKPAPFPDSQGYSTKRIPRPAGAPMPLGEVIARLDHALKETADDYHFVPSKEDYDAVERVIEVFEVLAKHGIEALQGLARSRCRRKNCGTACKCDPCHARAALAVLDPEWRP